MGSVCVGDFQWQIGFVFSSPVTHWRHQYNNTPFLKPTSNTFSSSPSCQVHPLRRFFPGASDFSFLKSSIVASASSLTGAGAGAGYSEQLPNVETNKTKKRVAGIDQEELLDPKLLADHDSCFCDFKGVQIHHKVYDAESQAQKFLQSQTFSQLPPINKKLGLPMILLHGFGASLFSWKRVMKPLAEVTGSKVLAFDRPAFGLTSRINLSQYSSSLTNDSKPLNPYSMVFSVLATLYFIDALAAEKAILVGHSAGSLVAVNTYFEAPERVAAMILIAPAIFAPLFSTKTKTKTTKENQSGGYNEIKEDSGSTVPKNPLFQMYKILRRIGKYISEAIMHTIKGMTDMLDFFYKRLLSAILRSAVGIMLVRMAIDKFGIAAVRNAWYDSNQVQEHVLHGYTKPLRAKDWDRALVEYTAAMLLDIESTSKPPLAQRLHEISCPVLIVTGDNDRIVPSWNAEKLSQAIPGSSFEVIKHCGHLPHEEKVEEFVAVVEKFLRSGVGNLDEHRLQAAT